MALTAGAVRLEDDQQVAQFGMFRSESWQAPDCAARLDLAPMGECADPDAALLVRQ